MTAPETKEPGTAVARTSKLPAEIVARVEENRQRNAVIAAIRGTMWGKDLNHDQVRAVAQYAREVGVDPVRHVEVLGGRIYLNAECYDEKGAPLIQAGIVQPMEPDIISKDERLEALAKDGDEWAITESTRRIRERIKHGVPEKAAAAVVTRFRITATGAVVTGVKWCGGGVRQRDPVGDAEPVKTAISRSRRRAWRQLATIIPQAREIFQPFEARVEEVEAVVLESAMPKDQGRIPARGTEGGAMQATGGYPDEEAPAPRLTPEQIARHAEAPDPYSVDVPPDEFPLDDAPVAPKRRNAVGEGR